MLSKINKLNIIKINKKLEIKKIYFNFYFISLIPPFIVNNVRLSFNYAINEKKILIKQSYILLTWFYYLSFIEKNNNNKNKLSFFVMPIKLKKFTTTKAPMAHKNWSKEQYKFQYYSFRIKFNSNLNEENNLHTLNNSILFLLLTKKNFPQFETNVLFLKNLNFFFYLSDKNFFNYYKFLNK